MKNFIISNPTTFNSQERKSFVILVVTIFVISIAIRLFCYTGLIGSDDILYSHYAQKISNGTYKLESHHYAIRYGVISPVGALYWAFGVHEWTTVLLPLVLSSLSAVFAALIAIKLSGLNAAWITGLLMATFPVDVRYASILVPEPFLQCILLGGVLLYLYALRNNSIYIGLATGFIFGLTYLTKEPGAFVAVAIWIYTLLNRRWRLALLIMSGIGAVVVAESIWYIVQSGDLLFRLHALGVHNVSPMALSGNEDLAYRLFKSYPRMMLIPDTDFGLHSFMAICFAAAALVRFRFSKKVIFLLLWATLPFLYLNFGTTSFSHYFALPAAPRYISIIYPPLFLLYAIFFTDWYGNKPKRGLIAGIVLTLICTVGVASAASTRGTGYNSELVHLLKKITANARINHEQICEFTGPRGDFWEDITKIIAPEILGCSGHNGIIVSPDSNGLPVAIHPTLSPDE